MNAAPRSRWRTQVGWFLVQLSLDRLVEMLEERFGRKAGTFLLGLLYLALISLSLGAVGGLLVGIWKFIGQPLTDLVLSGRSWKDVAGALPPYLIGGALSGVLGFLLLLLLSRLVHHASERGYPERFELREAVCRDCGGAMKTTLLPQFIAGARHEDVRDCIRALAARMQSVAAPKEE